MSSPTRRKLSQVIRTPLLWLAVLYLSTGLVYALVTPLFEKHDEDGHYGYILYLREHRALPPLWFSDGFPSEYKQPPLYYIVASALTGWLPESSNPERLLETNPYMDFSVPGQRNDNRNVFLHPPHMTPVVLGSRLVSLLFGLGTVLTAYYLTSQLFPNRSLIPLAVAAIVGFQPKFLYITTSINNDVAIAFFGALILTILVYRLQNGPFAYFATLVGGLLGLASVTKVSGLVFFPLTILAVFIIHRGFGRAFYRDCLVILAAASLIGGWWYARNALSYGDPLSIDVHVAEGTTSRTLAGRIGHDLSSIERTYWANLSRTFVSPTRLDQVLIWWGRTSLAALILGLLLKKHRAGPLTNRTLSLLLSWPTTFLLLLITYWTRRHAWAYGRLLFPAIAPLAVLFVLGWTYILPPNWSRLAITLGAGIVLIIGIATPFVSIYPLYHPWRELERAPVEHSTDITYVDPETESAVVRLVGYNLPQPYVLAGEYFPVELCWKPLSQTGEPYAISLQLLDLSQLKLSGSPGVWGGRRTYPGLGNLPTDRWTRNQPFCDKVLLQASPETPTPLGGNLEIGFTAPESDKRLQAQSPDGTPLDLALIRGIPVLSPKELPKQQRQPIADYVLDGAIGFVRARLSNAVDGAMTLTMTWQSLQAVPYDATVFVHLRGPEGEIQAQVDRQPLDGRYPTSYWLPGQLITDVVRLLPNHDEIDGSSTLNIGMYTWPSIERLAVIDAAGIPQRDDVIAAQIPFPLPDKEITVP